MVDLSEMTDAQLAARARKLRCQLARKDPAAFTSSCSATRRPARPSHNAPVHKLWHALISNHKRVCFWNHCGERQEAAARDTDPDADGWTTMGALRVGDVIFAGDGSATRRHLRDRDPLRTTVFPRRVRRRQLDRDR
jgi:hypothetical protein